MGKTTLATAVCEVLTQKGCNVIHHHSDMMRGTGDDKSGKYWPKAADLSIVDDPGAPPTVVLADKNLIPSPAGVYE
jgi:molybdopterin-guanine dinucleotide biosynthesis protein